MSENSKIEWTDSTWNPVTGCNKVSPGCKNCYAEVFAERWRGVAGHPYEQGFDLRLWPDRLNLPLTWKTPRMIFVNSMSDLFHERVPDEYIKRVFEIMCKANHHTFQVLTKRSTRMLEWAKKYQQKGLFKESHNKIPGNIWMGVSVESQTYVGRINDLQKVPVAIRFLSIEPLLSKVELNKTFLKGIHWVIVGGESGPGARPMDLEWPRLIRNQCEANNVAFFFKQWGAFNANGERVGKKVSGRILDGKTWNELPNNRIRKPLQYKFT